MFEKVLILMVDFFLLMVNDLLLFGKIVVVNVLSDVYVMGGIVFYVLNFVCFL